MSRWIKIPGTLKTIAAGGSGVMPGLSAAAEPTPAQQMIWGTNSTGAIFVRDYAKFATTNWQTHPGRLSQIAVGTKPDATGHCPVWGVNAQQSIFWLKVDRTRATWEQIPGTLKQISVGAAGVWGVNAKNQIFKFQSRAGTAGLWAPQPGSLASVATGDNDVWGVNATGQIFRSANVQNAEWEAVPGSHIQLSVAGSLVCGVNAKGELHYTHDRKTWKLLTNRGAPQLAQCSTNGQSVWALDRTGGIWLWGA
jgi:hypothetical protein